MSNYVISNFGELNRTQIAVRVRCRRFDFEMSLNNSSNGYYYLYDLSNLLFIASLLRRLLEDANINIMIHQLVVLFAYSDRKIPTLYSKDWCWCRVEM